MATRQQNGKLTNPAVIRDANIGHVETALINARAALKHQGRDLVITGFDGPDIPELRLMAQELAVIVLEDDD